MRLMKVLSLTVSAAGLLTAPAIASAQPNSDPSLEVEEIVVTAQKRSESLQDVPIAISAVTEAQLTRMGVSGITDLKVAVPTLNLTNSSGNLTSSLRGVGSNGIGAGVESPVAVYIDGVYIASPTSSLLSLNNIRQIEVLKGPQGTLFGRNATGGLIQVFTLDPSDTPTGRFSVGYGNYDTVNGAAYLAGALSNAVAMDLAVTASRQGDGWGTNRVNGLDVYKLDHDVAARTKLRFRAGETTTFTLAADYSDRRDSFAAFRVSPDTISGFVPERGPFPSLGYDTETDTQPVNDLWTGGGSLRWDQEIGDLTFMSLTAYRASRLDKLFDYDGSSAVMQSIYQHQHDDQFSQEFQLASADRQKLRWLAGLYYFDATSEVAPFQVRVHDAGIYPTVFNKQGSRSIAGYGQLTYELGTDTNLTLGGRYTSEKRKAFDGSRRVLAAATGVAGPVTTYDDIERTFSKFTYRVSLDHRFSPEFLGYASVNRGFKSGGFNTATPGSVPFEPETLDAYEAGFKSDLFDGRVRLNAAAFYYDYKNLQIQRLLAGAITVINGASARNYGIDADMVVAVTPNLRLTSGFGWNSPEFSSFPDCPISVPAGGAPSTTGSCEGNLIPLAARFSGSLAADYALRLESGTINFNGNIYYNSGFHPEADNVMKQERYALVGASVDYNLTSGISVGVYAKNLTNQRVINFATTIPNGTHTGYFQAPRSYGVRIGYSF